MATDAVAGAAMAGAQALSGVASAATSSMMTGAGGAYLAGLKVLAYTCVFNTNPLQVQSIGDYLLQRACLLDTDCCHKAVAHEVSKSATTCIT